MVAGLRLPAAAREQLDIALGIIDALDLQLVPFDSELHAIARKQPGARALIEQIYGVGALTAVTILAELGDVRRFQNSRDVVRYAGLDITVYQSDDHRAPGHLSRQGPPALRWALYEAAQRARLPRQPRPRLLLNNSPPGSAATAPASRSRASCSNAATSASRTLKEESCRKTLT